MRRISFVAAIACGCAAALLFQAEAGAQTRELATKGALLDRVAAVVNDGAILGTEASGVRASTPSEFSNRDAWVFSNGGGTNRFPIRAGTDGLMTAAEARTVLEEAFTIMSRARGPQSEKTTNFDLTMGLHGGYFIFPFLSAGLDLRYQHWLTDAPIVQADPTREVKDTATIEPGVRFHVKLSEKVTFRPGAALAFGFDNPLASSSYKILRLDLPLTF